ncbi:MAG TPA: GtrA family protein [Candidatus Paceibacterota bacterium]
MNRKDLYASLIIGGAVGLLVQPILANTLTSVHLTLVVRVGIFVFFTVFAPFALWLCSLIAKVWSAFYQFGQFAAVGTLNSFIDIGVLNLETFLYGGTISTPLFAVFKAISFLCATTNSFFWNRNWTFGSTDKVNAGEVTGFYTVALIGWAANVAVATFVKAIGPDTKLWVDVISPVAGILVTFIWNFIGYKYFVFKKKAPTAAAA